MSESRKKTLACDMLTLNYLRNVGFSDLAAEFQSSRRICPKVANSFQNLTIQKVQSYIKKRSIEEKIVRFQSTPSNEVKIQGFYQKCFIINYNTPLLVYNTPRKPSIKRWL